MECTTKGRAHVPRPLTLIEQPCPPRQLFRHEDADAPADVYGAKLRLRRSRRKGKNCDGGTPVGTPPSPSNCSPEQLLSSLFASTRDYARGRSGRSATVLLIADAFSGQGPSTSGVSETATGAPYLLVPTRRGCGQPEAITSKSALHGPNECPQTRDQVLRAASTSRSDLRRAPFNTFAAIRIIRAAIANQDACLTTATVA